MWSQTSGLVLRSSSFLGCTNRAQLLGPDYMAGLAGIPSLAHLSSQFFPAPSFPASFPSHHPQISGVLDIQFNYFLLNFNLIYFFLDVKLLFTPTSLPNNMKVQESFFSLSSYLACVSGAGWGGGPKEARICSTGGMFP